MDRLFNRNGSIRKPRHVRAKRFSPVAGVYVGGKKYTRFADIKTKSASKIGIKERARRGIALAIL